MLMGEGVSQRWLGEVKVSCSQARRDCHMEFTMLWSILESSWIFHEQNTALFFCDVQML